MALSYSNATFEYHQGDDFFEIQLDINAHDVVSKLGAKSSTQLWNDDFINLQDQIVGKSIHEIELNNTDKLNIPSLTYLMAVEDFKGQLHQNLKDYGKNTNQIICRCQGIDLAQLNKAVDKHQADLKKVTQDLKISLICGGCKKAYEQLVAASSWKKDFFADIANTRWIEMIDVAISRAKQIESPLIPKQLNYSIIKYENNKVKLRIDGDRNGKNRFELTQVMQNFLRQKVHPQIIVSVVV